MNTIWRRSSRCSSGGCVAVAATPDAVLIRDTKLDNSPILTFAVESWRAFIADLRGER